MLSNYEEKYWKEVTQLIAPSGCENNVAYYLKNEYQRLGYEIVTDNIGSIFALKKSKNPDAKRVMVVAHMDEVGFLLSKILPNGCCKGTPLGGIMPTTLQGNRVVCLNNKGKEIKGCVSSTGTAEVTKVQDTIFDFGFESAKEAIEAGLSVGLPIVCEGKFEITSNKKSIISKAIDDRYGIILGLAILNELKDVELPFDLYVGGSVQEEVGCRGALTCSYKIKPDFCIVLDCSVAHDMTGKCDNGNIGDGVLIRFLDKTMIAFKELLDLQIEACKATNSRYQYYEAAGGTDAGNIHKNLDGIPTLTHCICARSIHTTSTLMRISDYEDARNSLLYLLKNLNNDKIQSMKGRAL